jgi:hypothetical protein
VSGVRLPFGGGPVTVAARAPPVAVAAVLLADVLASRTREPTAADAAQRCAEYGFGLRYGDLPECARRQQLAGRQRAAGKPVTPGGMKAPRRLVCF